MLKQKISGIVLSALLFAGTVCGAALPADTTAYAEQSPARAAATALDERNAELFLPESYEQYLPLVDPSYVAIDDYHVVIADGKLLYVYDHRHQGNFTVYDAEKDASLSLSEKDYISKVQISQSGRCFFTIASQLYEYKFDFNTVEIINVQCSTFLVEGNYLYTAIVDNSTVYLRRYPLHNLSYSGQQLIATTNSDIASKLTCMDNVLYCARNNNYVVAYDITLEKPVQIGENSFLDSHSGPISDLQFICAFNGYLYYTVNGDKSGYENGLYRTDFEGHAESMIAGDGFSAIAAYNGSLYCIRDASIIRLDVTAEGVSYSGYEIAASSDSENRMRNVTDSVRAGNLLVTADAGAKRVSVYNFETRRYSSIACEFVPSLVATDGETIAVASGETVYTCKYGDEAFVAGCTENYKINGIACVYGSVYYVTENAVYGKVGEEETGVHSFRTPARLTRDLYGNLFMSNTDNEVYAFTEEEFLSKEGGTKLPFTLPEGYTVLRSDFEGNVYCLAGNTVYKNGFPFATVNGADFVWHRERNANEQPTNFALGFEDSEVYFTFGNYAVKSKADTLDIPTLDKIARETAREDTFTSHGTEDLFVDIPARTVGVLTDLATLKEDGDYFPYVSYYRLQENKRGVLLAQTAGYYLVLLNEGSSYTANLFRRNEEFLVPSEDYATEGEGRYFLSSGVAAYFAPCLETQLSELRLERGKDVIVLGYVSAPDYEYAHIRYTDETRAEKTGFVPKSFLSSISPVPPAGSEYLPVYVKQNVKGVTFTSESGIVYTIKTRTEGKATKNEDGTYTVCIRYENENCYATLDEDQIEWKDSGDAVRIALIVILSVLALLIVGGYVYLLPRNARDNAGKPAKKSKK